MDRRIALGAKPNGPARRQVAAIAVLCGAATLPACGGAPPPPPTTAPTATAAAPAEPLPPPEPEPIETGMDCATAKAECGGGVCLAKVNNKCETPVTCELSVMVTCSAQATAGQGKGTGRGTIPAGSEGEISADASCAGGNVELTVADGMTCH